VTRDLPRLERGLFKCLFWWFLELEGQGNFLIEVLTVFILKWRIVLDFSSYKTLAFAIFSSLSKNQISPNTPRYQGEIFTPVAHFQFQPEYSTAEYVCRRPLIQMDLPLLKHEKAKAASQFHSGIEGKDNDKELRGYEIGRAIDDVDDSAHEIEPELS